MDTKHIEFIETILSRINATIETGQILAKIIQPNGHFVIMRPLNFSHVLGHGLLLWLEQIEDQCGRKGDFLYFQPFGKDIFSPVFRYSRSFQDVTFGPTYKIEWIHQPST